MKYWLLKSEPNVWSIDQQKKAGLKGAVWDGVRNFQARSYLKKNENWRFMFFLSLKYWKRGCWHSENHKKSLYRQNR